MLIPGIIVTGASVILMVVIMLGGAFGAAFAKPNNEDKWAVGSLLLVIVCLIGYVVGLTLTAIGLAQELF